MVDGRQLHGLAAVREKHQHAPLADHLSGPRRDHTERAGEIAIVRNEVAPEAGNVILGLTILHARNLGTGSNTNQGISTLLPDHAGFLRLDTPGHRRPVRPVFPSCGCISLK